MKRLTLLLTLQLQNSGTKDFTPNKKQAFVKGNDVFIRCPTGFGKSLCFFTLPYILEARLEGPLHSMIIVISPLTFLMHEQATTVTSKGMRAVIIKSHENDMNIPEQWKTSIIDGSCQICFTSPETILRDKEWIDVFQSPVVTNRLVALIIDEVHCVKKSFCNANCLHNFVQLGSFAY